MVRLLTVGFQVLVGLLILWAALDIVPIVRREWHRLQHEADLDETLRDVR